MGTKNHLIPNVNDLRKQLDIIFACAPGAHEIRVIGRYYQTSLDGKKLERVLAKDSGEPQAYALSLVRSSKEALELLAKHFSDYPAHNCYMALNRVSDQFKLKAKPFQIGDRDFWLALTCTKIKDIQGICALIIDLDREETPTNNQNIKLAASPEELKTLDLARQEIGQELEKYSLKPNYQIMSGNGYQIVYFFPAQTDTTKTRKTIAAILEGLNLKYAGKVSVDTAMSDPARVARLCGVWNKKPERAEDKSQERVYRVATFLDGQAELNSYEDIEKLACAMKAWQEQAKPQKQASKAAEPKQPAKKIAAQPSQQFTAPSKLDNQLWIDEQLSKICLLDVLHKFHSIKVTGQSSGKTQILCPYHGDHSPSAWIDSSNGVELLHCSSPHCQVHQHAKTALHVYQDNGYSFLKACHELFGTVPPTYCKECYTCKAPIILEGKDRYNLDFTKHICPPKQAKQIPSKVQQKAEAPEPLEKPEKKKDVRLDLAKIHPIFERYIAGCRGKTDAPEEFIAVSFLESLAGAIGNKVCLKIGVNPIRPDLWAMLIAESTFLRKTTALRLAIMALQKLDGEKRKRHIEAMKAWEKAMEKWNNTKGQKGEPPQKPKEELNIYPTDLTAERLVEIMVAKPDGLFVFSELGEFLQKLERSYSQGFKEMLTDMYDCPEQYIRETKTSGKFLIEHPAPSIIGASTLSWLQKYLKDEDMLSGFLARFLFCIVREPRTPIAIPELFQLEASWVEFLRKLEAIKQDFEISKEAREHYCAWFEKHRLFAQEQNVFLHSFLGRLESQVHKLAMIFQCVDIALGQEMGNMISAKNYEYAINFAEYFKANLISCYDELTAPPDYKEVKVLEIIQKHSKKEGAITRDKLCRHSHMRVKDLDENTKYLNQQEICRMYY